jgi:nucleoside-diphosphate-sugar epimerase
MKKIILVIGGTGMLGQPVSLCLKEAGFQVRMMTRDRQKASKIFDDSFEIFAGIWGARRPETKRGNFLNILFPVCGREVLMFTPPTDNG